MPSPTAVLQHLKILSTSSRQSIPSLILNIQILALVVLLVLAIGLIHTFQLGVHYVASVQLWTGCCRQHFMNNVSNISRCVTRDRGSSATGIVEPTKVIRLK